MNEELTLNEYYWRCAELAIELGFNINQVRIFHEDIVNGFHDGIPAEDLVEEIF